MSRHPDWFLENLNDDQRASLEAADRTREPELAEVNVDYDARIRQDANLAFRNGGQVPASGNEKALEQLQAEGDPLTPIQAAVYDVLAAVDGIDASSVPADPEMLERIHLTDGQILAHTAAFAIIELRDRHLSKRGSAARK